MSSTASVICSELQICMIDALGTGSAHVIAAWPRSILGCSAPDGKWRALHLNTDGSLAQTAVPTKRVRL